jgi:hypothetical protein
MIEEIMVAFKMRLVNESTRREKLNGLVTGGMLSKLGVAQEAL